MGANRKPVGALALGKGLPNVAVRRKALGTVPAKILTPASRPIPQHARLTALAIKALGVGATVRRTTALLSSAPNARPGGYLATLGARTVYGLTVASLTANLNAVARRVTLGDGPTNPFTVGVRRSALGIR